MAALTVEFPQPIVELFSGKARYRIAYGGRDSGKSWSMARMLIARATAKPLRILCCREVQKSIADSVHRLIADQIQALGLGSRWEVLNHEIRGMNGSLILFRGLSTETRESIKSMEAIDIAWIEEAQTITQRSWELLTPTIRAEGSEVWASFNPTLDTDYIYQTFVANDPPPNSKVVKINRDQNPWRSKVLDAEAEHMRQTDPEGFAHVYGGECRPAVEGAIYAREVAQLREQRRLTSVSYDPLLPVHLVWDLGYADYMSIILAQRAGSEVRIIEYIEDRYRTLADYDREIRERGYRWGKCYLPHDGRAKDYRSGRSAEEIMRSLGWDVEITESLSVEEGIRAARHIFPRLWIDKDKAGQLLTRLARYRRRVSTHGEGSPVHDEHSHGADALRYLAIVADHFQNEQKTIADPYAAFRSAAYYV